MPRFTPLHSQLKNLIIFVLSAVYTSQSELFLSLAAQSQGPDSVIRTLWSMFRLTAGVCKKPGVAVEIATPEEAVCCLCPVGTVRRWIPESKDWGDGKTLHSISLHWRAAVVRLSEVFVATFYLQICAVCEQTNHSSYGFLENKHMALDYFSVHLQESVSRNGCFYWWRP